MPAMHHSQIGGGRVERPFTMGSRYLARNTILTRDEVLSIRTSNRGSLIDRGYLMVWPKEAAGLAAPQAKQAPGEMFVIHRGFGRYDVVEGRTVNQEPLDKESAYLLAGKPLPKNGDDKAN
jgi:hypothetical protein